MVGCTIFTLPFCLCVHVNVLAAGGVDGGGGFGTANGWTIMYTSKASPIPRARASSLPLAHHKCV